MTEMNDQIRDQVKRELERRELSQGKLAGMVGIERPNITRMLAGRIGKVPENWQRILDALDLELVTIPKHKDDEPKAS